MPAATPASVVAGNSTTTKVLAGKVLQNRDANGNWRLVWCWGYQRIDQEPAVAVVCGEEQSPYTSHDEMCT